MFKNVKIKFNNNRGSAIYQIPVILSTENKDKPNGTPKTYECHPYIQRDWEDFIKFSGDNTTKDWEIEWISIDDFSVSWLKPEISYGIFDYMTNAICKLNIDNINNITGVLDAYQDLFTAKKMLYDSNIWLKICRAADAFIERSNTESVNKIIICLNDAKLWCYDKIRDTSSILYGIDKREEFDDHYDTTMKYTYTDTGRCNIHDITTDCTTAITPIETQTDYHNIKDDIYAVIQRENDRSGHNGIFTIYGKHIDDIGEDVFKVMYYDIDIFSDPVNILGKNFDDYYKAKDAMYAYCSSIRCKFYNINDLNAYISEMVVDEQDLDRKLSLIEYGHRIIKEATVIN